MIQQFLNRPSPDQVILGSRPSKNSVRKKRIGARKAEKDQKPDFRTVRLELFAAQFLFNRHVIVLHRKTKNDFCNIMFPTSTATSDTQRFCAMFVQGILRDDTVLDFAIDVFHSFFSVRTPTDS